MRHHWSQDWPLPTWTRGISWVGGEHAAGIVLVAACITACADDSRSYGAVSTLGRGRAGASERTVSKLDAVDLDSRMEDANPGPVQVSVLLCKVVNVEPDQASA